MPRGGLRSTTILSNITFPTPDDLPSPPVNLNQNQSQNQPNPPVAVAAAPKIWSENSAEGTFNPGTKEGTSIFKLKTKNEIEKKFELVKSSAPEFHALQAK